MTPEEFMNRAKHFDMNRVRELAHKVNQLFEQENAELGEALLAMATLADAISTFVNDETEKELNEQAKLPDNAQEIDELERMYRLSGPSGNA